MQQIHKCIHLLWPCTLILTKSGYVFDVKTELFNFFLLDFKYVQSSLGGAVAYCEESNIRFLCLVI